MAKMQIKVIDNTAKTKAELHAKIIQALTAIGQHIEGEAMEELNNDPRHIDTGNLRNKITNEVNDSEQAVYVGTNVEYAVYVHEGTGIFEAHKKGRKTPWVYKDEKGNWHVTRGMKPNRFLKNAMMRNKDQIKTYIEQELKS